MILLYFVYNLVFAAARTAATGLPTGSEGKALVSGYLVLPVVYAAFAWATRMAMVAAAFVLYGVFTAATAGVERAFIAEIAPPTMKGRFSDSNPRSSASHFFAGERDRGRALGCVRSGGAFRLRTSLSFIAALVPRSDFLRKSRSRVTVSRNPFSGSVAASREGRQWMCRDAVTRFGEPGRGTFVRDAAEPARGCGEPQLPRRAGTRPAANDGTPG